MHAVARCGPLVGLVLWLLAPLGTVWAVTAVVGHQAPEFSLPSLHAGHGSVDLSQYHGKVVYLDFWSAWCAPCRRTMPVLDALRREFPRTDFEVIGVNVDPEAADGRRFLDQTAVSYPVVADPAGRVAGRFGVTVLPAGVLIDRQGVVRSAHHGDPLEPGRLRARLLDLMAGEAIR